MTPLQGKNIVLGVTGGIAAYKSCDIVSRLIKQGANVDVIMTKSACQFVAPLTFQTLSRRPVTTDTFASIEYWEVEHIALAKKADLFLIAPATANILAKMAQGIADDMLTTTLLATKAPLLIAPAMNTQMWQHPATQQNLETLKQRGAQVVGPEGGMLACGDVGAGRMSEPETIVDTVVRLLSAPQDMQGLNVLVTAGPTREKLDPVRFLSNHSSGRMGYAIAEAARRRGAQVTLITGPTSIEKPDVDVVSIQSTKELYDAMMLRAKKQDIIIQAAAPADFTPLSVSDEKIKKQGRDTLQLSLMSTPDVAKAVGEEKQPGQILIGFAAETENLLDNARAKLAKKNLDMIVLNDVTQPGAGFGVDTNIVTFVTQTTLEALPKMSKAEVADRLLSRALLLKEPHLKA